MENLSQAEISEIPEYINEQAELSGEPEVGYMEGDWELCWAHPTALPDSQHGPAALLSSGTLH